MFRKFQLGPLIGQRTWGGLAGTLGFPTLMDGGQLTAPNLAIWTDEDGWVIENEGVANRPLPRRRWRTSSLEPLGRPGSRRRLARVPRVRTHRREMMVMNPSR
jgi:hypothetical protein